MYKPYDSIVRPIKGEKMELLLDTGKIVISIVFALISFLLCRKILNISETLKINRKIPLIYCAVICVWYALSMMFSIKGFFNSMNEYSPGDITGMLFLILMMTIPLILFFFTYLKSGTLRKIITDVDISALIGIQVYRLCGGYFLLLAFSSKAPLIFALPTGIMDLVIGLFALIIPRLLTARKQTGTALSIAKAWNYMGLIDFASAFTIYFLYFPFRILEAPASQTLIGGFFPIAFIVMFAVPLAIILHVMTLMKLRLLDQSFK